MKTRLQAVIREQEQAAAASDADLRKKRNAVAALDARIADATATLTRLKDEVKAKREEVVSSVLDGRPLESFYVRARARRMGVACLLMHVSWCDARDADGMMCHGASLPLAGTSE